jgi:uncharacterized iron-regulated protein
MTHPRARAVFSREMFYRDIFSRDPKGSASPNRPHRPVARFALRSSIQNPKSKIQNGSAIQSILGAAILSLVSLSGCASSRTSAALNEYAGNPTLAGQFIAFDDARARRTPWSDIVQRAADADVVFFGEEHSNVVCNQLEAQLLADIARRRQVALAMEFFESDTQSRLNKYLSSDSDDEASFRKETRQGRLYAVSHRPLIEICRLAKLPVIAANAPRRFLREYRKSGLEYTAFRASLPEADRALLPEKSERIAGRYWDEFIKVMQNHSEDAPASQPASAPTPEWLANLEPGYRAQLLWDDSMAESVAKYRAANRASAVMLVVGRFHVSYAGGTLAKFKQRRPNDRVLTIVYQGSTEMPPKFDSEIKGIADIVVYGVTPPPEPKPTSAPSGS